MAETGPCGPCSEIHFDRGEKYCDMQDVEGHVCQVNGDCTRFLELWNLVFIQYNRLSPDQLEPLPATHVDTGMGFERIVSVLQDVDSNYKTDLFAASLETLRALTGDSEGEMLDNFTPYRVICDHARAAAFLIADGVVPGNVGRNYVCRMIIRRAARFGTKIGLTEPFMAKVAEAVIETYGDFYNELEKNRAAILDNLTREEERFARTVETGTAHLQNLLDKLRSSDTFALDGIKPPVLDGHHAFDLYATYGLPFEITRDIAKEQGLDVDEAGFREAMEEHRRASSGDPMATFGGEDAEFYAGVLKALQADGKLGPEGVEYDPYTSTRVEGEVLALIVDGKPVDSASFGDHAEVILPKTGFYIESGGQVSDTGYIRSLPLFSEKMGGAGGGWEIEITDMRKPSAGVIVHVGEVVSGQPKVGAQAIAEVDMPRRHDIMRNHTATHLMHTALRKVLGESARQAGSLVAPDRLRFDFTHPEAMTPEQIERVEKIVNDAVAADMTVTPKYKPREEAIKEGATALFGEKYGETVRTLTIKPSDSSFSSSTAERSKQERYSYELCGGTHLERTSDIGAFIITSEGSTAAGIRRIEAVTGRGAYNLIARRFKTLRQTANTLKSSIEEIPQKVESLQEEVAMLKKELTAMRSDTALSTFDHQLANVQQVKGVNLLAVEIPGLDKDALGKLADTFREKYPDNGICVVASPSEDSVVVMATITQDLIKKGLKAGDLVGHVSRQLGAGGGGAPHLAFGGGRDVSKIDEALASVPGWVQNKLK
jgi:alanyl-tRNA synthetase